MKRQKSSNTISPPPFCFVPIVFLNVKGGEEEEGLNKMQQKLKQLS